MQEIRIEQPIYERPEKWQFAGLLALFSAAILWKFRSIQQVADSLGIDYDVRAGVDMFNPHHLLFGPSVWFVYRFLNTIGLHVNSITAAQLYNIGWGVVGIVCFFFIMLKFSGRYVFAVLSALCLLFAHAYWQFSTQSEVYIGAIGPILIIIVRIFLYPEKQLSPSTFVTMLLLLTLSICYHQTGVFLLIPLTVYYYQTQGSKGLRFMALFSIASGLLSLGAYVYVYFVVADTHSIDGFIHYCLQYAYINPDWGTAKHFSSLGEWLKIFFNQSIAFLPVYHISKIPVWALAICYSILWGWNIRMAVKRTPNYKLRTFLLVWLVVFYLFLVWWTAGYEFFVLSLMPTLLLVLFMAYDLSLMAWRRFGKAWPIREPVYFVALPALILLVLLKYNMHSFMFYHNERDGSYREMQRAQELCGQCTIIANYDILLNLKYYCQNTNVLESDGLYIAYYYRDTVAQKYQLRKDSCVLAELWYLNPWYNSLGKTGWDVPAKWMKVAENFFDIRRVNDSIDCRRFTIYPSINGAGNYIKAGPERMRYADLERFFYALDDSISAKGIPVEAVYKGWLELYGAKFAKNKILFSQNVFQPDTSVNGMIFLSRSVINVLGEADKILDTTNDLLDAYYFSKPGNQYLRVIFSPGDFKNCFEQFEIGNSSYAKAKNKGHSLNLNSFETENKIKIGLTVDEVVKKKGTSFVERNDNGLRVLRYSMNNMEISPFLKHYNMPVYSEEFYFKDGILIKFLFGFDYP